MSPMCPYHRAPFLLKPRDAGEAGGRAGGQLSREACEWLNPCVIVKLALRRRRVILLLRLV